MTITISGDMESVLAAEARRQGTTPELLALNYLRDRFVGTSKREQSNGAGATLADFLEGHIGVLSSSEKVAGGAQMSEQSGKKFAAGLFEKRAQGRL